MSGINRGVLTKIHLAIACFIFPVALMFPITGALYAWNVKGSYITETHDLALTQALVKDAKQLQLLVMQELDKQSLDYPSGKAKIKSAGTSWYFEWTGANRDVTLEPTAAANSAQLKIKTTTWYRHLVQLHKAKGGQLFKGYAALFAMGLLTLLASGFIMAWQVPRFRQLAGMSSVLGILVFALALGLS